MEDELNLSLAHPPHELAPSTEDILQWAGSFASSSCADIASYGERVGLGEARIAIASWLTEEYAGAWSPSGTELVLTAGVSGAVALCAQLLNRWHADGSPLGSVALVPELSYELMPPVLEAAGLQIVRVPTDGEGVDPDAVERAAREQGIGAVRWLA